MKDLNEIIKKIEGDQQKIVDIRKILGYECFKCKEQSGGY